MHLPFGKTHDEDNYVEDADDYAGSRKGIVSDRPTVCFFVSTLLSHNRCILQTRNSYCMHNYKQERLFIKENVRL